MYGTESWAIPLLLDPEASIVAAHTAFAPVPGWRNPETGEIQSALLSAGPAYMINARIPEERKQLAWDYLQLAHGVEFSRILADQTGAGHRISALTDPDLVAKWPHLTANYEAAKVGIGRPAEPWWPEAENAVGRALQEVAAGGDPATIMVDANNGHQGNRRRRRLLRRGYHLCIGRTARRVCLREVGRTGLGPRRVHVV